jgi:DNA-directed RNA polymerase specialized sigma24 family protein
MSRSLIGTDYKNFCYAIKLAANYSRRFPYLDSFELKSIAMEAWRIGPDDPPGLVTIRTVRKMHDYHNREKRHRHLSYYDTVAREQHNLEGFEDLIKGLNTRTKKLLRLIFVEGMCQYEAANVLEVSPSRVHALLNVAYDRIKERYRDRLPHRSTNPSTHH